MNRIAIIDYGLGNIRSVANALEAVGGTPFLATEPSMLDEAAYIVLPGVGAFGDGMTRLRASGWVEALGREILEKGKPALGVCLGMQLLASLGMEHGRHEGLGFIAGTVERFAFQDLALRIPHIGWNDVRFEKASRVFPGPGETGCYYFVHSYVYHPEDPSVVAGVCSYGEDFPACLEQDNIFAAQFHPEKSQKHGLSILRNFIKVA